MTRWRWRTVRVDGTLPLPGWTPAGRAMLRGTDGAELLVVGDPAARTWLPGGILAASTPVEWSLEPDTAGAVLRVAGPADVDLLELDATAARDARAAPPAMTVLGSFAPAGGAGDLGRFLVGDEVLDTNDFGGRRCPSEQTALSLYRIARSRSGPFWAGVAEHLATVVERRVAAAPDGLPVHGVYGGSETHTRFLADAALLLLAHGRDDAAQRALDGLDALSVPWGGGRWTLHDSDERDRGDNLLVLNTHVQAVLARLAGGRAVYTDLRALDAALSLRPRRSRAAVDSVALAAADAAEGWAPERVRGSAAALARRAQRRAGRSRAAHQHLLLPSGWIARDRAALPAPAYLTVNLHDLAGLCRNRPTARTARALHRGLRYARASGYFRAQRQAGHPQCVVQPIALRLAGKHRAAATAATAAAAAGWAPAVGWPGHEDDLWPLLASGTP